MTTNIVVSRITLFSENMDKVAEFYKAIGLNLEKSGSWGGNYNYLDIIKHDKQNIIFEIFPLWSKTITSMQGLGFDVVNVPQVLQKLIEIGAPVLRPSNPKIHARCTLASVKDPDGRVVTITQHGKAEPV